MHIIVDGYNLIRQSPRLLREERRSLEQGRNALLRWLKPYGQARRHRITVVFDGWERGEAQEERDRQGALHIVYSRRGEKADDVIRRIVARSGEEILVVTSDRAVATFVERRGGAVLSSPAFEELLDRQGMAAGEEGEEEKAVAEPEEERRIKKGPCRRLSKKERRTRQALRKL